MSRDSVLLLPPRGNRNTFSVASQCVWFGSRIDKGWVHTTPYFLVCERILPSFFLPNQILLLLNNDSSWKISQTSETWEFVPGILEVHGFQMERLEEGAEQRKEVGGWRMVEAWTLDHFWLPSAIWSVPGRRTGSSGPETVPAFIRRWVVVELSLPRAVMGFSSTIWKNAYGLTITKHPTWIFVISPQVVYLQPQVVDPRGFHSFPRSCPLARAGGGLSRQLWVNNRQV